MRQSSRTMNSQDESQYYLSNLPPDEQQSVDVVGAQQLASDANEEFYLSELPPDQEQPVSVVGAQQSASDANEEFYLSELPPDQEQLVDMVTGQALDTPLPDDDRQSSEIRVDMKSMPSLEDLQIRPLKDLHYMDTLDTSHIAEGTIELLSPQLPLDYHEMYRIIREVALIDSSDRVFSEISKNEEFTTPNQPAYNQRQFGLAYGFLRFTQASKHLGSLLQIMQRREPQLFAEIFAPHAEELLQVVTAPTEAERLQSVGSEVLWSESWVAKFKHAATIPAFQAAQNEEAIESLFKPMLQIAYNLGFVTDRGLALVFDRVVAQGLGTGIRWVIGATNILPTNSHRMAALELLHHADVASFQATVDWIPQGEQFGPHTYAALVGALRSEQAMPLPTISDLQQRLLHKAQGSAKLRLDVLADSAGFDDIVYSLT